MNESVDKENLLSSPSTQKNVIITEYNIFPGIKIIYNDIHSGSIPLSDKNLKKDILVVNYCHQGRIEWEFGNGKYCYLGEDDLSLYMNNNAIKDIRFPLEHYHGVTLIIDIKEITPIVPMLNSFNVDIAEIGEKLCGNNRFCVKRKDDSLNHIFSEFYKVPGKIREYYFKIKILELLLLLSTMENTEQDTTTYFKKSDIQKVKLIRKYITEHLQERITLEELSQRFCFSLTSMKLCFKSVYGLSINQFIRSYRLQTASAMIRTTDESIINIAGKVGYSNASKFSSAFRNEFGVLPNEYRKNSYLEHF